MKKNKFSNWREDLREVVDVPPKDSDNGREIKEKKVKNKVVINPTMKEAFDELGGTILEIEEIEEGLFGKPKPLGKSKVTYGGEPEKKDTRMGVSAADIKAKTPAAQRLASGDPRYKKIGEETLDPQTQKQLAAKANMLKKQQLLQKQQLQMQKQGKLPMGHATMEEVEQVDENIIQKAMDVVDKINRTNQKKVDMINKIRPGSASMPKHGYFSPQKNPVEIQKQSFEPEGEMVDEKLNLKKTDMGKVIKDFKKSDAPQFKGKSEEKKRQMAIAAKLTAERGGKKLGESAVPGKPAEKLKTDRNMFSVSDEDRNAARERLLAKSKAKREKMKEESEGGQIIENEAVKRVLASLPASQRKAAITSKAQAKEIRKKEDEKKKGVRYPIQPFPMSSRFD